MAFLVPSNVNVPQASKTARTNLELSLFKSPAQVFRSFVFLRENFEPLYCILSGFWMWVLSSIANFKDFPDIRRTNFCIQVNRAEEAVSAVLFFIVHDVPERRLSSEVHRFNVYESSPQIIAGALEPEYFRSSSCTWFCFANDVSVHVFFSLVSLVTTKLARVPSSS